MAAATGGDIESVHNICKHNNIWPDFCIAKLQRAYKDIGDPEVRATILAAVPAACDPASCVWCMGNVNCGYQQTRLKWNRQNLALGVDSMAMLLSARLCVKSIQLRTDTARLNYGRTVEIMYDFNAVTECIATLRAGRNDVDWLNEYNATATFHSTELPDLVSLTSYVPWNVENTTRYKIPILHLLSKLPPCRCLFRGWTQAVIRYCKESPSVIATMQHMLGSSLLGLYPWSAGEYSTQFCNIYIIASDVLRVNTEAALIHFVENYPHVLFYAAKEALLFYTKLNHTLCMALHTVYNFPNFESDIIRWSQQMRASLADSGSSPTRWVHVERIAKRFSTNSTYVHKLIKCPFHKSVISTLKKIGAVSTDDECSKGAIARLCSRASITVIEENIAELLYCCGTSTLFGKFVGEMHAAYGRGALSNNRVQRALSMWPERDITILFSVLGCAQRVDFVEHIPVTAEIYRKQRRSLQLRYAVEDSLCSMRLQIAIERNLAHCVDHGQEVTLPDGQSVLYTGDETILTHHADPLQIVSLTIPPEKLPPNAGLVYFCPECVDFKAFVNDDNPLNIHAVGNPRVLYDTETEKVRCNRRKVCGGRGCTEVIPVNLLGKIVRFSVNATIWYTLCPRCAAVTKWELRKTLNPCGFCCDECLAEDEKLRISALRKHVRCVYCDVTHNEERTWTKMNVYKSISENKGKVEEVHLCQRHSCRWLSGTRLEDRALTLDQLILFISRQRDGRFK